MDSRDATKRYVRTGGLEVHPAGEQLIATHLGNDEIHRLNLAAKQVLEACEERSAAEIIAILQGIYPDVPGEQVAEDVELLLKELLEKDLIRTQVPGKA